jgi:osmotically-inducible protein OsmY
MRRGKNLFAAAVLMAALVLAIAPALPTHGASHEETAMAETKKPLGAGDAGKANAKLEQAVRAKLDEDAEIKAAKLTVSADVTRNHVTLAGTVASEALRERAVELAKSAHAGVIVNDKIRVKRAAPRAGPAPGKRFYS